MPGPFARALLGLTIFAPCAAALAEEGGQPQPSAIYLTFRGLVDGSDRITITRKEATWKHVFWQMPPGPITLNGVEWDPSATATLKNEGATEFLKFPVDFRSARLQKVEGRDVVAIEPHDDWIEVILNDMPSGDSLYEFQVVLRPPGTVAVVPKRPGGVRAKLKIVADIDGGDELHIGKQGARWVHEEWQWPEEVRLNDVRWKPRESDVVKNDGPTRFLPDGVDLSTAKIVGRKARDTAVMEVVEDGLILHLADAPFDREDYEVELTFGE